MDSISTTLAARSRRPITYAELRKDAIAHARRFIALGINPGDRIAMVAETGPEFAACFFGAVYAGAWPVPLPLPTSFGGRDAYVDQLADPTEELRPCALLFPEELAEFGPRRRREGRNHSEQLGYAGERGTQRPPTFRLLSLTISLICNIPAAPRVFRTVSPSPTARCSTTFMRTRSG